MEFSNLLASCMNLQSDNQGNALLQQQLSNQATDVSIPSCNLKNFSSTMNLPRPIEALTSQSILQNSIQPGFPMLKEIKVRNYLNGNMSFGVSKLVQPSERLTMLQGVKQLSRLKSAVSDKNNNTNQTSMNNKRKGNTLAKSKNMTYQEKACRRKIKMLLKTRSTLNLTGTADLCYIEKVEELLFRTAPNMNVYSDEKTLNTRLRSLLVALNRRRIRVKVPFKKIEAPPEIPV